MKLPSDLLARHAGYSTPLAHPRAVKGLLPHFGI